MNTIEVNDAQKKNNQTRNDVVNEMNRGNGELKNLGGHSVSVQWGMNEAAKRDGVMQITVGGKAGVISVDDLLRYTRWATV